MGSKLLLSSCMASLIMKRAVVCETVGINLCYKVMQIVLKCVMILFVHICVMRLSCSNVLYHCSAQMCYEFVQRVGQKGMPLCFALKQMVDCMSEARANFLALWLCLMPSSWPRYRFNTLVSNAAHTRPLSLNLGTFLCSADVKEPGKCDRPIECH